MQKLYRYDSATLKYLGFVLLLNGCTLADPENYTDVAPEDESKLTDYTWDAEKKAWQAITSTAGQADTTTTTSGG